MLFGKTEKKDFVKNDIPSVVALFILALSCLLSGIFGEEFMRITLGYAYSISVAGYSVKAIQWLSSIVIAILFYKFVISKSDFFHKAHNPEIEFGTMNLLTVIFFASLLVYVLIM